MGLNQTIAKALTLYTGSVVSHVVPDGTNTTMVMLSSSLPPYNASFFNYGINQKAVTNTTITQTPILDLQVTLANSTRYLINAYILVGSNLNTNGVQVGFSATNVTTNIYNIETPISTTSTQLGVNQTVATLNSPSSAASNLYCCIIRAMVVTAPTGVPVVGPTFASEIGGQVAVVGPSYLYCFQY